jgi:hypothetical protein
VSWVTKFSADDRKVIHRPLRPVWDGLSVFSLYAATAGLKGIPKLGLWPSDLI